MSRSTVQKISREALHVEWGGPSSSFQTPTKKGQIKKLKLDNIKPDEIKRIREIIYDFYILEKKLPTLKGKFIIH